MTYNDSIAKKLTSRIINRLKEHILSRENKKYDFQDEIQLDVHNIEIYVELSFSEKYNQPFHVNAGYGRYYHNKQSFIGVEITINPKYKVRNLELIYFDLLASIRHEIEHYYQRHADERFTSTRPVEPPEEYKRVHDIALDTDDFNDYVNLPSELAGNYKGIRLMSKKMKIPFKDAALMYFTRMGKVNPKESTRKLMDYIENIKK